MQEQVHKIQIIEKFVVKGAVHTDSWSNSIKSIYGPFNLTDINSDGTVLVLNWYQLLYPSISNFEIKEKTPQYQELEGFTIEVKSERSWLWTMWLFQLLIFIVIPACLSKLLPSIYNYYHSNRKYRNYHALKT